MDAVIALGIAGGRVVVGALYHRIRSVLSSDLSFVREDGEVRKSFRLPWVLRLQDDLLPHRPMQYTFHACRAHHPEIVHEKLSIGPYIDWCLELEFRIGPPF